MTTLAVFSMASPLPPRPPPGARSSLPSRALPMSLAFHRAGLRCFRLALVAFAGTALLAMPPTLAQSAFDHLVRCHFTQVETQIRL